MIVLLRALIVTRQFVSDSEQTARQVTENNGQGGRSVQVEILRDMLRKQNNGGD
jgi:hypothetical protein